MFNTDFERKFHAFADSYFYRPTRAQILLAYALLPLSALYTLGVFIKFYAAKGSQKEFGLPVISIGNLTLGGSGKTPLCAAIANEFSGGFIVLRGYGRKSKGCIRICADGEILTDVKTSGDEAMEYAKSVANANVIVSEDRKAGIELAENLGARYVLLDDGFGKFNIKKFNVLIAPKSSPRLNFTLPSGAYRYPPAFAKFADFTAREGESHFRKSEILRPTAKMVLVTAIANPARLSEHFSATIAQIFYPDHYDFTREELVKILTDFGATSLLVTQKDFVKIENFNLPVSLISLKTTLSPEFKALLNAEISV